MTIEHLGLAIGAFLIMVIWIKLRSMSARLRKMEKKVEEFHISYDLMAAMMQKGGGHKSPAEVISLVPPSNPVETEQQTSVPKIVR